MAMTTADVGNGIKKIGQYTMYAGVFGLFVMAVVGTFAIDMVMIAALQKQAREGQTINFLFTLYIWHCFSGSSKNPFLLLLISPFTTLLAIGLSVAYDVSFVGMFLAGGWVIAAGLVIAGFAMYQLGKWLSEEKPVEAQTHRFGLFDSAQSRPSAPPHEPEDLIYNADGTAIPVATAYPENPYLTCFSGF